MKEFNDKKVSIIFILIALLCFYFICYKIYLYSFKSCQASCMHFEKCIADKGRPSIMPFL